MTAISAVRLLVRPARLTLILVAAAVAVVATILVNSHTASACEASRRQVHHQTYAAHPAHLASKVSGRPAAAARHPRLKLTAHPRRLSAMRPIAFVARTQQSAPALPAQAPAPAAEAASPVQPPPPALVTLPAVPTVPSHPVAHPEPPSHPAAAASRLGLPLLSDPNFVSRLESALSLAAFACVFPLLAIIVVLQLRLLRLLRLRQPEMASKASKPLTRHYSLTQEQARELAPDLVTALAHHRFCESERHHGRQKRATWLELEEADSEPTRMWATCETCHHQRMTELSGRGRLAAQ